MKLFNYIIYCLSFFEHAAFPLGNNKNLVWFVIPGVIKSHSNLKRLFEVFSNGNAALVLGEGDTEWVQGWARIAHSSSN